MIQDIFSLSNGQLLKIVIAFVGITTIILHILPKSQKKQGAAGFVGEILNFIKGIFNK